MLKSTRIVIVIAALGSGSAALAALKAPAPCVSMAAAKACVLKPAPGKIISSEYQKKGGGWHYSFDIQQPGHVQEIGNDAQTVRIVETKPEGKATTISEEQARR